MERRKSFFCKCCWWKIRFKSCPLGVVHLPCHQGWAFPRVHRVGQWTSCANRDDPFNGTSCFLHWISFLSNVWHKRISVGCIWIIILIVPQTSTLNHSFFFFFLRKTTENSQWAWRDERYFVSKSCHNRIHIHSGCFGATDDLAATFLYVSLLLHSVRLSMSSSYDSVCCSKFCYFVDEQDRSTSPAVRFYKICL